MKKNLLLVISLFFLSVTYGQHPWLIKDINTTGATNILNDGTVIGAGSVDGTSSGGQFAPRDIYSVNGALIFFGTDGNGNKGIFKTDGTPSGTNFVIALPFTSGISYTLNAGNILYFLLYENNIFVLWRTDGTAVGTFRIFTPDANKSFVFANSAHANGTSIGTVMGNNLYFFSNDLVLGGVTTTKIYKTDGTLNGTAVYLSQPKQSGTVSYSFGYGMIGFNNKIYFDFNINDAASGATNYGSEIYSTDGITTQMVSDLTVGTGGSTIYQWVNVNDQYLVINGIFGNKYQIMRLKKGESSPVILLDNTSVGGFSATNLFWGIQNSFGINSKPEFSVINGNKLYFKVNIPGTTKTATYVTNGEPDGTFKLGLDESILATTLLGVSSAGLLFSHSPSFAGVAKVYKWDGASANSYKTLTDSLTSFDWGGSIVAAVQINDKILCLNGNATSLYLTDTAGSFCFRLMRNFSVNGRGVVLNGDYVALANSSSIGFDSGIEPYKIPISRLTLWTGIQSSDWNSANNWLPSSVPNSTSEVIIPPTGNNPIITNTASCKNLIISGINIFKNGTYSFSNTALTINKPGSLNISDYIFNLGYIEGSGSLNITGSNNSQVRTFGCDAAKALYNNTKSSPFNIDTVSINGANWDFTNVNLSFPNSLSINSLIQFKSANKVICNKTGIFLLRKPIGYDSSRFILDNRNQGTSLKYVIPSGKLDSTGAIPSGNRLNSYSPAYISYPVNSAVVGYYATILLQDSVQKNGLAGARIDSNVVKKTWTITNAGNNATERIKLGWPANDEGINFNRNKCIVLVYANSVWKALGGYQSATVQNGTYYIEQPVAITSNKVLQFIIADSIQAASLVGNIVAPAINVTASANNICNGTGVTFTATATNAGITPTYQWLKNGVGVGANSANYTDNSIADNDIISCRLTSSAGVGVYSGVVPGNNIIMTVNVSCIPVINSFTPATGPVGTLITITGTNLTNFISFNIGGKQAIVISNTGTTLVGMVMPGAITGSVSLATNAGTVTATGSFAVTATPYPVTQQGAKLMGTGNTGAAGQAYSVALSADGNTAILGGFQDNSNVGAAWIYTRSGNTWTQQGNKLVGTGNTGASQQGISVALSADGNTAIVGGYQDNSKQGAVWIYARNGNTWTQQGSKLLGTGNTGNAQQGGAVSLSADGNTAIVGGWADNSTLGAAWIFTRTAGTWTQQGPKLVGTGNSSATSRQGGSVAMSADGNTAMVGGWNDGTLGAAWVYARNGNTWAQQGNKLTGTGNTGTASQGFSVALSADGNTGIIGGLNDNTNQGAAWVFTRNGSTWTQQGAKLVGTGNTGAAYQGGSASISADGNTAIIGAYADNSSQGASWVFTRNGSSWAQQGPKLVGTGNTGSAEQGFSVALSADGSTAMAGGWTDNINQGAAWVFTAGNLSGNANLSALTTTAVALSPVFTSTTTAYTATVPNTTSSITITPTASDVTATITVNGIIVTSGSASAAIPLTVGTNPIPVMVKAQDGVTMKTYIISVTRTSLPTPVITLGNITGTIATCSGTASTSMQQFSITGSALTGSITLTVAAGFEISTITSTGFGNSITLAAISGTVSATNIYVRTGSVAPAGNISGTVTASSSGAATQTVLVNATVNSSPLIPLLIYNQRALLNDTAVSICQGSSINLVSGYGFRQWFKDTITNIVCASCSSYVATAPGKYQLKSTLNNCSAISSSFILIVKALPAAPVITVNGPITFCSGGSVTLTSSAATGNQWYKDGVAITNAVNANYTTTVSGSYTDTVSNGGSCKTGSAATVVTFNATITTPVISAGGATEFCSGGSVVLNSSSATGNQWYNDTVAIAGATNKTYTATISGNYYVRVTFGGGCSATSSPFTVKVYSAPSTPKLSASGTTNICAGDSVTLTIEYNPLITSYRWYKDGVAIANAGNASYTATTGGSYTDTVTFTGGCKTGSLSTTVSVNALPSVPTISTGGPTTFCSSASVVFTSSSATGNQWYKGGALISGAANATYTANASGSYTDTVTNAGGCKAGSTATTITAVVVATPTIRQQADTLISSAVNGNQWYLNSTVVAGAVNQKHKILNTGTYSVKVTDVNGCISAFSSNFPVVITAVNTVSVNNKDWKLYPNPVSTGVLFIQRTGNITGNVTAQITTQDGRVVAEKSIGSNNQWNIASLPNGYYYLRIIEKKATSVYQFIKQ